MGVCGGPKFPHADKIQMCLDKSNFFSHTLGNQWKDVSGNNRHMYASDGSGLSNSTTIDASDYISGSWRPGLVNQAGGWAGHSGSALTAASNGLGITNSTGVTIHLIKMDTGAKAQSAQFKFFMGDGAGNDARGLFSHCLWSSGGVYFDSNGNTGTGSGDGRVQNLSDYHDQDTWQHWTFTKDTGSSGSNTQTIYKDGTQVAQRTNAGVIPTMTADPIVLGYDDVYAGVTSERYGMFVVWNTCLTATEVDRLYHCIAGNAYDVPSGRWVAP